MPQFRAKARAVDLLGKGQIADLPTAITELWKNGFDAYADNLSAELYLKDYKKSDYDFFVMSDDGKGMSRKDIFEKWLVLGTDSKSRESNEDKEGEETLYKKPRIKAGEKGIGRLSVSYLGSPMLMLTKKQGHPLQGLYFDWRLLENYNLFLDDVNIPIENIDTLSSFKDVFIKLKSDFLLNFEKTSDAQGNAIWEEEQITLKNKIVSFSESLTTPSFFEEELVSGLLDIPSSHGTIFIIFQPEQQIIDLNRDYEEKRENDFVLKSISGFTNKFTNTPLPISVTFSIHKTIGNDYDLLTGSGDFFTPNDFDLGDIIIDGQFDGLGSFNGNIKLYTDEPFKYSYTNPRKKDSRNTYGPFDFKMGYLMGREEESKLTGDQYQKFSKKLSRLGSLYIYRDGFRVLPYGRTEYDFLDFENRRLLRAGDFFFSQRRIYGYIAITRKQNEFLKDKASREGLINNAAYRAFKDDLISFFIEIAKQYFATEAKSSLFLDKTAKLKDQSKAIKQDKEREKQEKIKFTKSLKDYPDNFSSYQTKYKTLLADLENKVNQTNVIYSDIETLLNEINKLDLIYSDLLPPIQLKKE